MLESSFLVLLLIYCAALDKPLHPLESLFHYLLNEEVAPDDF